MHTLEECEFTSTEYFDECQECGPLPSCTCLYSIPLLSDYGIYRPSGSAVFTFTYWTMNGRKGEGSALSYREAMDKIAHAVNCEEVARAINYEGGGE